MSRPIIKALSKNDQNLKFIISFYSPSGFNHIKLDEESFLKIYLPLDLKSIHKKYLEVIKPKAIIFIKYDFWFNFLKSLNEKGIPYFFTSLHLNRSSYILKPFFFRFKELLMKAQKIYCHNPMSFDILKENKFQNLELFGDSRIDQVLLNKDIQGHNFNFENNKKTIIFGSATHYEIPYIIKHCNQFKEYNYIIAPHDLTTSIIQKLKEGLQSETHYYSSQISKINHGILIVDTYGDLKFLYRNADLAYVGAGFEKGPHNVLEPLIYKIPVLTGNNIKKFPMSQYLVKINLLKILNSIEDLNLIDDYLNKFDNHSFRSKCDIFFEKNNTNLQGLVKELNL